jgi:hypothetical protein
MYKSLEKYIDEIDHYLVAGQDKKDILLEIESYIIEKTESRFGEATEEGIRAVISEYGSPREIAEKYMEGRQIVSPAFQNYLFLYTAVLFAVHLGLYLISLVTGDDIALIPFLYVPRVNPALILIYLPMAFIYDFGLVSLALYIITQKNRNLRLPWFKGGFGKTGRKRRIIVPLVFMTLIFIPMLYFLMKYGTLFAVYHLENGEYSLYLLSDDTLKQCSALLLAIIAAAILSLLLKLFYRSDVLEASISLVQLAVLYVIINLPYAKALDVIPGSGLRAEVLYGFKSLFVLITVLVTVKLVKKIINFSISKINVLQK